MVSLGEAMVWSVDGSACVRLLDVTLLDGGVWTDVTSWLRERERELSEKTPVLFQQGDGEVTLRVIKTSWLCPNRLCTAWHRHTCAHTPSHTQENRGHTCYHTYLNHEKWYSQASGDIILRIPVKRCCCRLVCTHMYTQTHTHTHLCVKRDDLEHNVNSRHWLES